tara:strand:+ start:358 stop:1104 length:747 start_codon:yes stop_codon:yes gene_type:complete
MKSKLLKKICGIFGYKLIEKKAFKNKRLVSQNSSLTLKKVLQVLFEENKIISLIQIGANDGLSFDELNFYIKKYKSKSLLIEPIKENFDLLKENYKKYDHVILENLAISVNNEISYLYKVDNKFINKYGSHISAIPSFDKKHLINHGVKNAHIIEEKVESMSILNLINKYKFQDLDLLFLDTEGYDGKIVYDFLSTVDKKPIIVFEYIHVDNIIFEKLINKLLEKEYLFFMIEENIICYPKETKITIN